MQAGMDGSDVVTLFVNDRRSVLSVAVAIVLGNAVQYEDHSHDRCIPRAGRQEPPAVETNLDFCSSPSFLAVHVFFYYLVSPSLISCGFLSCHES